MSNNSSAVVQNGNFLKLIAIIAGSTLAVLFVLSASTISNKSNYFSSDAILSKSSQSYTSLSLLNETEKLALFDDFKILFSRSV